jgi:hypothetical protein
VVAGLQPSEIEGFENYPPKVRKLLEDALALTRQNLGYQFGSADPAQKGMDCSGTIFFLLKKSGVKEVPRSSEAIYQWVLKEGTLQPVNADSLESRSFAALRPGDLLFWTGTYAAGGKNIVTHTMIYLGRARSDGLRLMVGASDGRTYRGKKCFGVSVFDFRLPKAGSKSRFVGYARIPGLERPAAGQAAADTGAQAAGTTEDVEPASKNWGSNSRLASSNSSSSRPTSR